MESVAKSSKGRRESRKGPQGLLRSYHPASSTSQHFSNRYVFFYSETLHDASRDRAPGFQLGHGLAFVFRFGQNACRDPWPGHRKSFRSPRTVVANSLRSRMATWQPQGLPWRRSLRSSARSRSLCAWRSRSGKATTGLSRFAVGSRSWRHRSTTRPWPAFLRCWGRRRCPRSSPWWTRPLFRARY